MLPGPISKLVFVSSLNLLGVLCCLLQGCVSWRVAHDLDARYDFSAAHSVAVLPLALQGMQPVWVSELVADRLRDTLKDALQEKGFVLRTADRADLLVEPGFHAEPEADMTIWGGYSWWSPYGPYGHYPTPATTEINTRLRVVLFLNVRDRSNGRLVYRAWSTEPLGPRVPGRAQLRRIINTLLQALPESSVGDVGARHQTTGDHGRGSSEESAP